MGHLGVTSTLFTRWQIHDVLPVCSELLALEGFRHVVSLHLICWAVLYLYITLLDLIRDKEIPDLYMPGALAHTLVTILLQLDSTLVIL